MPRSHAAAALAATLAAALATVLAAALALAAGQSAACAATVSRRLRAARIGSYEFLQRAVRLASAQRGGLRYGKEAAREGAPDRSQWR